MKDGHFVSIIIPALNEENAIERCLRSIYSLDISQKQFEVIVVDNGSTDKTREIAERYNAKVLLLPKVSIAALRNHGAQSARGDILAFLDADCTAEKGWLTSALSSLVDKDIAAVGSVYKIPEDASWVAKAWRLHTLKKQSASFVNYIPSGNCVVCRACFFEVDGFDEDLSVSEDTDLCFRLRQKNYKILHNQDVGAIHWGAPQTLLQFFKKELWYGKDVFRKFLDSKMSMQNLKVVLYTLLYVFIIIGTVVALLMLNYGLALGFIIAAVFISLLLATKTIIEKKALQYSAALLVLYLIYGFARALCIIDVRNWSVRKQ